MGWKPASKQQAIPLEGGSQRSQQATLLTSAELRRGIRRNAITASMMEGNSRAAKFENILNIYLGRKASTGEEIAE